MANFKPTVLSKEFITAVNDAQTSAKVITFDSVVASQTVLTDDATNNLTYATAQQCSQDVIGTVNAYRNQDPNTLIIDSNINNKSLSNDIKVATLLIYGQYDGKKILIATARLVTNDLLPKFDGSPVTLEYELYLSIQGASNVTINVNESGLATRKDVADLDSRSVHDTGNETVNGVKTFIQKIIGNITNADRATTAGTADQLKTGNQSINGSLTVPIDNSMINVGNDADLAMVKKQGQGGTLVVGNGKTLKIQKSSAAKISPTDTLTDLLTVNQNGIVSANAFIGMDIIRFVPTNITTIADLVKQLLSDINGVGNGYFASVKYMSVGKSFSDCPITDTYLLIEISARNARAYVDVTDSNNNKASVNYTNGVAGAWSNYSKDSTVVHNNGDETVNGKKSFGSTITVGQSAYGGTSIELYGQLPYIDFHYGNSTSDYTSRIIENSNGQLSFVNASGVQTIKTNIDGNAATATAPKSTGIGVNTDLNSLRSDGYYTFMAGSVINSPVYGWFSLTVTTIGAYNGNQVLIDSNTGDIWVRSWNKNNVYTDWKNTSFSEKVKLQMLPENYNVDGIRSGGNYTGTNGKLV